MTSILILDTSYSLQIIRERQLEQALESRKLGGYFVSVISAHPLAGLLKSGPETCGDPAVTRLDASHVFVEGNICYSRFLRFIPRLNFILAQWKLHRLLMKMCRNAKIKLVRVGDPYYLGLFGWVLARRLGVPLVIRVGARYDDIVKAQGRPILPRVFGTRRIEKIVERFVFSRCDLIAGANEDNLRYALENGGRVDFSTVFRYGNLIHASHWLAPDARADASNELRPLGLENQKFAMTVARLQPGKFVEDALRCIAQVIQHGFDIKLLVVGDGVLRNDLAELSEALGITNSVVFAGIRSQEWLAAVLPNAALVVSPQMGRALTESALAGAPVVAYDYDWQRELVTDGETGYLVAHGDWKSMAVGVEQILKNPEDALRLGRNMRAKAIAMMDPDILDRHEQSEYSKLLARFSSASRRNN